MDIWPKRLTEHNDFLILLFSKYNCDNTMAKEKETKGHTVIYKPLSRILRIE